MRSERVRNFTADGPFPMTTRVPCVSSVNTPVALYLNLLKQSILEDLYTENEVRLLYLRSCVEGKEVFREDVYFDVRRRWKHAYDEYVRLREFGLAYQRPMRYVGFSNTMLNRARVDNIEFCLDRIREENVAGDLMECGVWRGGAVIFMRGYLAVHAIDDRSVWVADSFEGLPGPDIRHKEPQPSIQLDPMPAVDLDTVKNLFARYGLLDDQVRFLKGWFKDVLPDAPVEKLALLRVDGDLYVSTIDALSALYSRVTPGGFVIIDDYGCYETCRRAVAEFRHRHGIVEPIHSVDWTAIYWRRAA